MEKLKKSFENFKEEAELFFVTKFKITDKIEDEFQFSLDVIFNITGEKDVTKGVLGRSSDYGQGKSFFFDVVHHRTKRLFNKNVYKRTSSIELCNIFTNTEQGKDPVKELEKFISVKNLYIDDIGEELKDGKERTNYGNRLNVLRHVFLYRYRLFNEKGFRLFGTSNLTDEQFRKNYGDRVFDRLQQMMYFRDFTFYKGFSFRRVKDSRKLTQEEIRKNWLKVQKEVHREKIDEIGYFNSMLQESEEKLQMIGDYFYIYCDRFLKSKGIITDSDLKVIDDSMKDAALSLIKKDIRESLRLSLKSAPPGVYTRRLEDAIRQIDNEAVFKKCTCIIAKRKFLQLKKDKHIFD